MSRRSVLGGILAGFAVAVEAGCSPQKGGPSAQPGRSTSTGSGGAVSTSAPVLNPQQYRLRMLRRLTAAPTAASVAEIERLGTDAWLDTQLAGNATESVELNTALAAIDAMVNPLASPAAGSTELRRQAFASAIAAKTSLMAAYSVNQLREVMVGIWSDHLHVTSTAQPEVFLVYSYDQLLREHALGRYRDLLLATAKSPAMLVYLDQAKSRADGQHVPNENYARELLELHTVGVDGGYDETDVLRVAYVLSGWSADERGEFVFRQRRHALGPAAGATILGWKVAGEGASAGEGFIAHLAGLPATARRVALKVGRRLVSESLQPTDAIVESAAQVYIDNDTSIAAVVEHFVRSPEFSADTALLRRPLDHLAAVLRTSATLTEGFNADSAQLIRGAQLAMGQFAYGWPSPDGYPTGSAAWANAGALISRWNTTYALFQAPVAGLTLRDAAPVAGDSSAGLVHNMVPGDVDPSLSQAVGQVLAAAPNPDNPDARTLAAARTVISASPAFELI
jgi:uncharacterized protein (DUF1800 family)